MCAVVVARTLCDARFERLFGGKLSDEKQRQRDLPLLRGAVYRKQVFFAEGLNARTGVPLPKNAGVECSIHLSCWSNFNGFRPQQENFPTERGNLVVLAQERFWRDPAGSTNFFLREAILGHEGRHPMYGLDLDHLSSSLRLQLLALLVAMSLDQHLSNFTPTFGTRASGGAPWKRQPGGIRITLGRNGANCSRVDRVATRSLPSTTSRWI